MITQLRAQNFKSWCDTGDLEIAPLTGLFGTNSSGKTALLQVLLMLKQTVESPDRSRVLHTGDDRSLVDLGTFFDVIYGHDADAALTLSLSWSLPERLVVDDPERRDSLFTTSALSFRTVIEQRPVPNVKYFSYHFSYHFNEFEFGMSRANSPKTGAKIRHEYNLVTSNYPAKRTLGRKWPLPSPVKCYGFPDEAVGYYQNTGFLPDFVLQFEALFSRIAYLGPLREYPRRSYLWAGESPLDVGRRGELAIPALLAARAKGKYISPGPRKRRRTLEEQVGEWLKAMGLIHSFSLRPIAENRKDYELRVTTEPGSAEVLITDVGFGVSQLLPVLVLCYYVPENTTLLLEQPEIHLHPSAQAILADVLIDVVKHRKVQVIVESHSEHLLARIQRRIAENVLSPDDTALYFCRMDQAKSRIERLQVDLFGNITNWPANFFGDTMGDRISMTEAALRRQGASL